MEWEVPFIVPVHFGDLELARAVPDRFVVQAWDIGQLLSEDGIGRVKQGMYPV